LHLTLTTFMPHLRGLHVDRLDVSDERIAITVTTVRRSVPCPLCRRRSTTVHSHYDRQVADLPWSGVAVALQVRTRKFFCLNTACTRKIFCERLPDLVAVYGRRTHHLHAWLRRIGFALGGQPGARLAGAQHIAAGRTTLLRTIRSTELGPLPTPRVLGVDDWSWRRGRTYGTLLTDLERHRPVDLLPDRTADTFAQWLTAHPGVDIISRDRAGAYAEGARRGAPHALQVADRFHVVKNLGDIVEQVVARHHASLRQASVMLAAVAAPAAGSHTLMDTLPVAPVTPLTPRVRQRQDTRRARRLSLYKEVRALHTDGHSQRTIARTVGLSRETVQRFVEADEFPERRERAPRTPLFAPYEPYLRERWAAGCQEAATLWREIRAQGYTGSASGLRQHLRQWRTTPARSGPRPKRLVRTHTPPPPKRRPFSVRQTKWLLLRTPEALDTEEAAFLARFRTLCPEIETTYDLAHAFKRLIHARDQAALDPWLARATHSAITEFEGFAKSIRKDRAAIDAALTTEWSNGQLEGGVNKLKTLKRQMYGRASFDLLRQRTLYVA